MRTNITNASYEDICVGTQGHDVSKTKTDKYKTFYDI